MDQKVLIKHLKEMAAGWSEIAGMASSELFVSEADDFAATSEYLSESVFPRLHESLAKLGKINVKAEATKEYGLSESFLIDRFQASDQFPEADYKFESGWLISKRFEESQRQDQVSAIRAMTEPCSLDNLAQMFNVGNL